MTTTVTIPTRFCGPPSTGNGGYVAGILATAFDGPVEVTLRKPPPLDRSLQIEPGPPTRLHAGADVVAEARQAPLDVDVPPVPTFESAETIACAFAGFTRHAFPGCFVCGPHRSPGDGLRIFPGRLPGSGVVAAPWVPDASLADEDGRVLPEILWAALDCPGFFAAADDGETAVLGRITAEVDATITAGERCVVVGWPLGRAGRKLHAGTAVVDASGTVRGRSLQTWIVV